MPRLFPADLDVFLKHSGSDVRIADGSDFGFYIVVVGPVEKTLIGHDGDSDLV